MRGDSMATTLDKPRPTHREEQPIRECPGCGAYMRSYQEGDKCDPCSKGEQPGPKTQEEVWAALADGDLAVRRALIEALGQAA